MGTEWVSPPLIPVQLRGCFLSEVSHSTPVVYVYGRGGEGGHSTIFIEGGSHSTPALIYRGEVTTFSEVRGGRFE